MEKREIRGLWFLPNKNDKVAGILHMQRNGDYSLVLHGNLLDVEDPNREYAVDTILGDTSEGLVTLFSCVVIKEERSWFHSSEEYITRNILLGDHFHSRDEVVFKQYRIYFPYLNDWAGYTNFKNDATRSQFTVTYEMREALNLARVNDYNFRLQTQLSQEISRHQKSMKEDFYIEVTNSVGATIQLDDFTRNILVPLQNFFTFAIGSPVYPMNIVGYKESGRSFAEPGIEDEDKESFSFASSTDIYMEIPYMREENVSSISFHEMILPFTTIKDDTNELLNNWFELNKTYLPIIDLYFGNIYNMHLYQHNRFLNIMQALESYHRIKFGPGSLMPEDKYTSIVSDIFSLIDSNLDSEYQKNFKAKFEYLNNTNLSRRIRELIDPHKETLSLAFKPNSVFIRAVVEARNNMTHLDYRDKEQWDYQETSKYLLYITILFEVCLLSDLGINEEYIKKIIEQKSVKYR